MDTLFAVLAGIGQAGFFSRFLVQWLHSERTGRPETPRVFWWISLFASGFLGSYLLYTNKPVLFAGQAINATIYLRNLWLSRKREGRRMSTARLAAFGTVAVLALFWLGVRKAEGGAVTTGPWLAVAIVGQGIWSSRFVIQWWYTERKRVSHFPPSFWWLSLFGNALLLAYSLYLGDWLIIVGYLMGPIVQVRNLMLHARSSSRAEAAEAVEHDEPRPRRHASV